MTQPVEVSPADARALAHAEQALRMVCASFPHLVGLAAAVRLVLDRRIPTAAVAPSGRVLINPDWFGTLDRYASVFVMAHELLHLCLRSHERGHGTDGELWNWAHDYIINDMLAHEMNRDVPAGGLVHKGARLLSAEKVVQMLRSGQLPGPRTRSDLSIALEEAGLVPRGGGRTALGCDDVLSAERERELFPDSNPLTEEQVRARIQDLAARSVSLGVLKEHLDAVERRGRGDEEGSEQAQTEALRTFYRPPWELALQQWMEAVCPGPRTFARPSRRGADRTDLVLPGHKREGWTLHIVLDTSGSMSGDIPRVLGVIASFCESVNANRIHILQCDVRVTRDDLVTPEELYRYTIAGLGGSDMSPALVQLAQDPEVEAVLVLTDGYISYPNYRMPYEVLWVLMDESNRESFTPDYGRVLVLPPRPRD
jgi:predicted metal-dependent peptidase